MQTTATDSEQGADDTPAAREGTATIDDALTARERQPVAVLFGLSVHTVVLDPGHGGVDPGAIGAAVDGRRLREKDLTLDLARRLAALLRAGEGFRVLLTRERDETMSLARRVAFANAANADLFVSIHANALADSRVNAVETYYFGKPADDATGLLARRENSESGLTMADFRQLIMSMGDTLKREESLALARRLQAALVEGVMQRSGPPDAGVKVAPFAVLLGVHAPAVLAEVTCISSGREAARLVVAEYREQIADALRRGIAEYVTARNGTDSGATNHGQTISEGESRGKGNG